MMLLNAIYIYSGATIVFLLYDSMQTLNDLLRFIVVHHCLLRAATCMLIWQCYGIGDTCNCSQVLPICHGADQM